VGRAMATNPVAPVVPCHRVIASDGSLGGFSGTGGLAFKRELLQMEGWL
jgi:methylated-DNA-[protein]-cysteine S-methyltransferase